MNLTTYYNGKKRAVLLLYRQTVNRNYYMQMRVYGNYQYTDLTGQVLIKEPYVEICKFSELITNIDSNLIQVTPANMYIIEDTILKEVATKLYNNFDNLYIHEHKGKRQLVLNIYSCQERGKKYITPLYIKSKHNIISHAGMRLVLTNCTNISTSEFYTSLSNTEQQNFRDLLYSFTSFDVCLAMIRK